MCYTPLTIRRKNASVFGSYTRQVPCGKCSHCLRRRQRGWTFRLMEEAKHSSSCSFITLTYETAPLSPNGLPTLDKTDFQKFMKRLRKHPECLRKVKYYACGEYGSQTHRPHFHAIMFNLPLQWLNKTPEVIADLWKHGHVDVAQGNELTMAYVSKYIMKGNWLKKDIVDTETGEYITDDRQPEFSLMSKNMGAAFMTENMKKYLKKNFKDTSALEDFAPLYPATTKSGFSLKPKGRFYTDSPMKPAKNHL